jgi:beta-glucosidase
MTWAKQLSDYAANDPAHPERSAKGVDGKTTFSEGVLVGYRWFDRQKIQPQFPFGFGLSYTRFEASGLHIDRASDGGATVTVVVRNVGEVPGDAVPQVYLDQPAGEIPGVQFAPRTLAAFERISLAPKESKTVTLSIAARAFQYWATSTNAWVAPPGTRTVRVGFSSGELPLSASLP